MVDHVAYTTNWNESFVCSDCDATAVRMNDGDYIIHVGIIGKQIPLYDVNGITYHTSDTMYRHGDTKYVSAASWQVWAIVVAHPSPAGRQIPTDRALLSSLQ